MDMERGERSQGTRFSHHDTGDILELIVGLLLIVFFVFCIIMRIQTTEAWVLGDQQQSIFHPNLAIVKQPIQIFTDTMSSLEAQAILTAWIIELVFMAAVVGHSKILSSVKKSHPIIVQLSDTAIVLITLFDVWNDYSYGSTGNGFWGHIVFAFIMMVGTSICGNVGLKFLLDAIDALKK